MPAAQGKWPRKYIEGQMVGPDQNGRNVANSVDYRGRPFCKVNAIEQEAIDHTKEVVRVSQQMGLRVVGIALTTGTIRPGS